MTGRNTCPYGTDEPSRSLFARDLVAVREEQTRFAEMIRARDEVQAIDARYVRGEVTRVAVELAVQASNRARVLHDECDVGRRRLMNDAANDDEQDRLLDVNDRRYALNARTLHHERDRNRYEENLIKAKHAHEQAEINLQDDGWAVDQGKRLRNGNLFGGKQPRPRDEIQSQLGRELDDAARRLALAERSLAKFEQEVESSKREYAEIDSARDAIREEIIARIVAQY